MLYEIIVFMIALTIFGAFMYIWYNWIAPDRTNPNRELLKNVDKFKTISHEELKELLKKNKKK